MEGSKKNFAIGLDAYLQVLKERQFNTMQADCASENKRLLDDMEKEAEATLYNSHDQYDVEYDI